MNVSGLSFRLDPSQLSLYFKYDNFLQIQTLKLSFDTFGFLDIQKPLKITFNFELELEQNRMSNARKIVYIRFLSCCCSFSPFKPTSQV